MGLDITAYTGLQKIDAVFDADGEPIDPTTREPLPWQTHVQFTVNGDFPGREAGVEHRTVYTYTDSHGFRAGSYGGYNGWRDELARLAGYPKAKYKRFENIEAESHSAGAWETDGGPFWELILFSDCEGVIGSVVAAKLAKDFAEFDERAKEFDGGPFWYDRYCEWRKAFEMAAVDGAVSFH